MQVSRRSVADSTSMEETCFPTKVLLSEDRGERESYSCFLEGDAEETAHDNVTEMVAVTDMEGSTSTEVSMYEVLRQRCDSREDPVLTMGMMRQRRRLACSSPGYSSFVDDLESDDEGVAGAVSFPRSASSTEVRKRKRVIGHSQEQTSEEHAVVEVDDKTLENETRAEDADSKRKRIVPWEVDDVQALVQRSLDFNNVDKSDMQATRENYTHLFKRWLNMKQKDEVDEDLVASARVLQPENLYQHFEEFLPYNPEDYDMKVQYERACAERALKEAKERSWLLRRSSYNRRFNGNLKVSPKAQGPMANSMRMSNNSAWADSSLSFYAFSYKKPNKAIGHLLCVKFGDSNKWAFASSSGVNIELEAFYDHFVDLLAFMLRCTGSLPKRVVLGYLTLEALAHGK